MAKEVLKPNKIIAPTLFVGVGGTGSKIINRVAKLCLPEEMENINFVVLDTNVNDLSAISTSSGHLFRIQTSNTQTVGNYLDYDQDACQNWFPKNAVIYDKTVSEGAGQVRAISRLALNACIKTGNISPLYDAIDALFKKTGNAMQQAMRVVIASTASGGTGSGMILPLSMLIRDYVNTQYPNTSLIVRSIILLPETLNNVIKSSIERDSQARNAYATIKEINAFMMKGSGFLDVDEDLKRYKDIHVDITTTGKGDVKPLSLLPFDFCFLLDGQDSNDSTMVGIEQYMDQAAQALYEQNIGPMQAGAFSVEDNIIKEMADPGNLGRNRFGGIGASVMRYPYERIADYIAYDWVIDSIGDEASGKTSSWTRYDKLYKKRREDEANKGASETECTKIEDFYCEQIANEGSNKLNKFSQDIWQKYAKDNEANLNFYYKTIIEECEKNVKANPLLIKQISKLEQIKDKSYTTSDEREEAKGDLQTLDVLWKIVRENAYKIATSYSYSLFYNDNSFDNSNPTANCIEKVFMNAVDEIYHPNAARYAIYKLMKKFNAQLAKSKAEENTKQTEDIAVYTGSSEAFYKSAAFKRMKNAPTTFKQLLDIADDAKNLRGKKKRAVYYRDVADKMNGYASEIDEFIKIVCEHAVCENGLAFVKGLDEGYRKFFDSFQKKAKGIKRIQEDLVDELSFTKGDSTFNICADRAMLKELSIENQAAGEKSTLLSSELNGKIFAAVKKNVVIDRTTLSSAISSEERRVDIFDDILLGYFKDGVRKDCPNLNLNIYDALRLEYRLGLYIKAREKQSRLKAQGESSNIEVSINADAENRHVLDRIAKARRLAAPGIQPPKNVQPRDIQLCSYNRELLDDQNFKKIKDALASSSAVESVSRYEMHFYNAIYNLTPDKIIKFYCPRKTETRNRKAGTYHRAYVEYQSKIGPDSTKNKVISTHIDKRWDSISSMPEIDLEFQHERMMRIHKALVRALVYNFVKIENYTVIQRGKKLVYKYENHSKRKENLIVSNGTLCDNFYEILDALYNSPETVQNIEIRRRALLDADATDHNDFSQSEFGKGLAEFKIPVTEEILEGEDKGKYRRKEIKGTSSIFEIPLTYYESLPNNLRYIAEISNMVDAVIACLKEELELWENEDDVKFRLCDILNEQFDLLIDNYTKENSYMTGEFALAKDNPIVEIIFRKIIDAMKESPAPDDYETLMAEMKKQLYS